VLKKNINIVLGVIQILISVYWIYEMISLYYRYHYTDILFTFICADWVLVSNILFSIVNLYFGIKLLNKKILIQRSYLTMLILITVCGLINNLSID
jgi:hypothetical protein